MIDLVPGTGGPRQPDPRLPPSHRTFRTLLGRAGAGGGLTISADANTFTLEMKDVPVVDQPRWPAIDTLATPARRTLKMVWKSTGEPVIYDDASRQFRFTGFRASCRLEAQVEVPSIGFAWKSDPLEKSQAAFAIVGEEVNGRYYK
jgi:hypothetical protein